MAKSPRPKTRNGPEPDIMITHYEVIIRNIIWSHSGGAIMNCFDNNIPNCYYTLKFVKDDKGKVIPGNPVTLIFSNSDDLILAKLIGIDFYY